MNAITKQNGNGHLDPAIMESLVIGGDLSGLNNKQRIDYYGYRCSQAGLDPSAKPFDLLKLNGKLILYANAGCTQQLCQIHGLSPTITDRTIIEGICAVTSRVTGKDGRVTENIGAVPVKGLAGDALANAMMKAVTKAHRRTILAHCGLGMLSEDEVETIPGAQMERQGRGNPLRQEFAALSFELDACKSQEQIDLLFDSPEFKDFEERDSRQPSGMSFAGMMRDRAEQMKKKLPERVRYEGNRIVATTHAEAEIAHDTRKFTAADKAAAQAQIDAGRESDVAAAQSSRSNSAEPSSHPDTGGFVQVEGEMLGGFSAIATKCMEQFDIVDTADDFKAAQKFATDHQKELTADEKKALNELSRRVGARLRETA